MSAAAQACPAQGHGGRRCGAGSLSGLQQGVQGLSQVLQQAQWWLCWLLPPGSGGGGGGGSCLWRVGCLALAELPWMLHRSLAGDIACCSRHSGGYPAGGVGEGGWGNRGMG